MFRPALDRSADSSQEALPAIGTHLYFIVLLTAT